MSGFVHDHLSVIPLDAIDCEFARLTGFEDLGGRHDNAGHDNALDTLVAEQGGFLLGVERHAKVAAAHVFDTGKPARENIVNYRRFDKRLYGVHRKPSFPSRKRVSRQKSSGASGYNVYAGETVAPLPDVQLGRLTDSFARAA